MRVLLLGPNGFIGSSIARQLLSEGHEVTGLGRGPPPVSPAFAGWIRADLNRLTDAAAWATHLQCVEVVVNASGALQTGARDRAARQHTMRTISDNILGTAGLERRRRVT